MVLCLCTSSDGGHRFHRKNSKGHISIKSVGGVMVHSLHNCRIVVYICTNFHENILDGIKVIERTRF